MTTILRPPLEVEVPKTLYVNHASTPLAVDWPSMQSGPAVIETDFAVPLGPKGEAWLETTPYRKLHVMVMGTKGTPFIRVGAIFSGFLYEDMTFPVDGHIHTFDIVGPELQMYICGLTSMAKEDVKLWVYLTS